MDIQNKNIQANQNKMKYYMKIWDKPNNKKLNTRHQSKGN